MENWSSKRPIPPVRHALSGEQNLNWASEKESGKVVEKLVTDKTGTATSGKIPIAIKKWKIEKTVEYILVRPKHQMVMN